MAEKGVSSFTKLLLKISEDLTTDDLGNMKDILEFDEILQARKLEGACTGLAIFKLLKEAGKLSSDELSLLKSILESMKKLELRDLVEEFEKSNCQKTAVQSPIGVVQETGFEDAMTSRKERLIQTPSCQPLFGSSVSFDSDATLIKQQFYSNDVLPSSESRNYAHAEDPRLSLHGSNVEVRVGRVCSLTEEIETDCRLAEPRTQSSKFLNMESSSVEKVEEDMHHQDSVSKLDDYLKNSLCTYDSAKPISIKLREYQLELAGPSLDGQNNIICAPTGSGKTLTAGYIFQERWKLAANEGKVFRGLFVVCQRTLVLQQKKALEDFYPLDSGISVGIVEENKLLGEVLLLRYCLIVLTAQKLVNHLEATSDGIKDFEMLIMDECHHTDLNHPYNKIMRFYHGLRREDPNRVLPMIVGLTASLGVGSGRQETAALQHYINICANLNCTHITHVRQIENEEELLRFNPKPSADQIKSVQPRAKDSPFYQVITQFMGNIEKEAKLIYSKPHERGTQAYENWIVEHKMNAMHRDDLQHIIVACEALGKLNIAWMLHDQMQIQDAKEFLDSCFPPEPLPINPIPIQSQILKWYMNASEKLKDLALNETIEQCPQLHELCQLLRHLHHSHLDPRGILLTRTRLGADRLITFLEQQTEFQDIIFPAKFVGQGSTENAMTQAEQENTLRRFRLGGEDPARVNLLVATDVAQEGLDMPKCNYVIRYNFVSNEIGSVQSRGRARAPHSELYLIVTRGSINETRELDNLMKEHQMQEALKEVDALDRRQLEKDIADLQEKNWLDYENQLARNQARSSAIDSSLVTIHCSKCKSCLCMASELRIRGSNYICTADDFEDRVIFKESSRKKEFTSEIHLGTILCKGPTCSGNKLGLKIKYKQGGRMYGLVLRREGCVWQQKGKEEFKTIKQWSKVPFTISKELI